jgi:hypothetical protein
VKLTDKDIAMRMLIRRGVKPIDVKQENEEAMASISTRNARGNISLKFRRILTDADLNKKRAERREKLEPR